jgi:uncharacterized cysteine cluster protein YcgN (CxxCxxCC family)
MFLVEAIAVQDIHMAMHNASFKLWQQKSLQLHKMHSDPPLLCDECGHPKMNLRMILQILWWKLMAAQIIKNT